MLILDGAARAGTIAILAVLSIVLGREWRRIPFAWPAIVFIFTVSAHLIVSWPGYVRAGGFDPILKTGALAVPGVFLIFSRSFFEDERDVRLSEVAIVAGLVAIGWLRYSSMGNVAAVASYAGSATVVLWALARVVVGIRADLIEPRRRFRIVFTAVIGLQVLAVLGAEVVMAGVRPAEGLETLKSTGAFVLAALFVTWFLTPRPAFVAPEPAVVGSAAHPAPTVAVPSEDARHTERLLALMRGAKAYRREGVTISMLARELDIPEYRLRRIIHERLGYRNFNAFVNDLRIEEACQVLADPAQERLPILNLALDLGYGSSGPFNRAFRAKTGQTPTEYRRTQLGSSSPAAESPANS